MRFSYTSSMLANVTLALGLLLALSHIGESIVDPNALVIGPLGGLQVGFYKGRCHNNKDLDIQAFIEAEVAHQFQYKPRLLPLLLRLQFHDCFVNGCDASIMIDGDNVEKAAPANGGVGDYEFIEDVKAKVEARCPGIVSCADIIAIATKVVFKQGGGKDYAVETGRRDGLRSVKDDVKLPHPALSVPETFKFFDAKRMSLKQMVLLTGCHTVGKAHCPFFQDRVYNDTSAYDPLMNGLLRLKLEQICPQDRTSNNDAFLDQSEVHPDMFNIDNSFFKQIYYEKRGLLPIDQALAEHDSTKGFVKRFADDSNLFHDELAEAMKSLQRVGVLTGLKGNIRTFCNKFN